MFLQMPQGAIAQPDPSGEWLNTDTNWNTAGAPIPQAPTYEDGSNVANCEISMRSATLPEDALVEEAGWTLTGSAQIHGSTTLITGMADADGMCRPLDYQVFVFTDGEFAGTLSPIPMDSRTDGDLVRAILYRDGFIDASFNRYKPDDPLCCASGQSRLFYEVERQGGSPVLVPQLPASTFFEDNASTEDASEQPNTAVRANLETYDETATGIPVITQYPADTMEVVSTGSGEGVGIFFTFQPTGTHMDEADVHVFLPSGAALGEELEPFITGENGLLENNGWILDNAANIEDSPYADDLSYPWVERVIAFSTDMEESGVILLGQTEGQAVQVTLFYPAEMIDTYWPNAMTILDNLTFDADLLPLTASEGL